MRNNYKPGDPIREIGTTKLGVFKRYDESGKFCYFNYADGPKAEMFLPVDNIADPDHPIHDMLVKWKAEGKARGFDSIYVARDEAGKRFKAFYGFGSTGLDKIRQKHPGLHFIFVSPLPMH